MTVNPGVEYQLAEEEFQNASTAEEKLKALQKMWSTVPKHKSSEGLQRQIKQKLSKYKDLLRKEKSFKRGSSSLSIKKEGSATISIIGVPNSGKSTLLKKLTNSNVLIADYPFSTVKPEVGILNYKGILLQIIEIPAITENFEETEKVRDKIWNSLGLIKVYTKQPGKKFEYPPLSLKKGDTVRELAERVHKDFVKNFKFARIWGKSAKFEGQRIGIDHKLRDEDIVEFHTS